ncbi:hypothetical protein F3K02_16040 [Hydrogenophaga sp. D2P1]|uniref:Uncharacterized protein n=1 Tax=Hydrogenophaga aromaticivorans TaxID=2610898 RepID=A0A7Y8GXL7_9BURK|nr:hypothetical protein [Hydrogenophaga aromaticivorans]NWF46750.1 hypothetical protein [Hydrogenophaga aromaticivorans]
MTVHYTNRPELTMIGGQLSAEYILGLKAELDRLRKQWAELPAIIDKRQKLYEAALLFAPEGFDPDASVEPIDAGAQDGEGVEEDEEPKAGTSDAGFSIEVGGPADFALSPTEHHSSKTTWISAVREVLKLVEKGIPHKELLVLIRQTHPELPVSNGEKGFYNAVFRLTERKELVKQGGLLYATSVVQTMEARGEKLPEAPEHQVRRGSSGEIVLEVLKAYPNGLTGPELRKVVSQMPNAAKSLREHGQYIYNILATLMGTGAVVKNGAIYQLAKEEP